MLWVNFIKCIHPLGIEPDFKKLYGPMASLWDDPSDKYLTADKFLWIFEWNLSMCYIYGIYVRMTLKRKYDIDYIKFIVIVIIKNELIKKSIIIYNLWF